MQKHEIYLNFVDTQNESISTLCNCQFCNSVIYFYLFKKWGLSNDYQVRNLNHTFHRCSRPTSWSESKSIPEGWEYNRADYDDDSACFIAKKYSIFDKAF